MMYRMGKQKGTKSDMQATRPTTLVPIHATSGPLSSHFCDEIHLWIEQNICNNGKVVPSGSGMEVANFALERL